MLAIIERLRLDGTGILHVTHDLADVLRADRAAVLNRGEIVFEGAIHDLLGEAELLGSCGLEVPAISKPVAAVRAGGAPIQSPKSRSAAELAQALWR